MKVFDAQALDRKFLAWNDENPVWTAERVQSLICTQEVVDAEPVVRCKDCEHALWDYKKSKVEYCRERFPIVPRTGEDYCSRAKRKAD